MNAEYSWPAWRRTTSVGAEPRERGHLLEVGSVRAPVADRDLVEPSRLVAHHRIPGALADRPRRERRRKPARGRSTRAATGGWARTRRSPGRDARAGRGRGRAPGRWWRDRCGRPARRSRAASPTGRRRSAARTVSCVIARARAQGRRQRSAHRDAGRLQGGAHRPGVLHGPRGVAVQADRVGGERDQRSRPRSRSAPRARCSRPAPRPRPASVMTAPGRPRGTRVPSRA